MRKIRYSHRGGVNNGKILLIRNAVKHCRSVNNKKNILIRTATLRIASSFFLSKSRENSIFSYTTELHSHDDLSKVESTTN